VFYGVGGWVPGFQRFQRFHIEVCDLGFRTCDSESHCTGNRGAGTKSHLGGHYIRATGVRDKNPTSRVTLHGEQESRDTILPQWSNIRRTEEQGQDLTSVVTIYGQQGSGTKIPLRVSHFTENRGAERGNNLTSVVTIYGK
jgi:hypothetical protein